MYSLLPQSPEQTKLTHKDNLNPMTTISQIESEFDREFVSYLDENNNPVYGKIHQQIKLFYRSKITELLEEQKLKEKLTTGALDEDELAAYNQAVKHQQTKIEQSLK